MICPKCGAETSDEGDFCIACGVALTERGAALKSSAPIRGEGPGAAPSEEQVLWEGHPSMKPVIPSLVFIVVVIAALYGIFYYLVGFLGTRGQGIPDNFWNLVAPALAAVAALIILFQLIRQWIRKITVRYSVSSQRIFVKHGVFSKRHDEIELEHYKDVIVNRGMLDSLVGCGDIRVMTSDPTHPIVELTDVGDPLGKKEIIRGAAEARKRSLGIVRREEL